MERSRFRAGEEHGSRAHKIAQLMRHGSSILGASNLSSAAWVPFDIFFLWLELRQSGWRLCDLKTALHRIVLSNNNLHALLQWSFALVDVLESLLQNECNQGDAADNCVTWLVCVGLSFWIVLCFVLLH